MDRIDDMKDFIQKTTILYEEKVEQLGRENYENSWLFQHPEKRKECINRYASYKQEQWKELTIQEKRDVKNFYKNCPKELEVDHIIPLSKGGRHHVTNLQYLTVTENRKKWNKIK
jgi:hypothetical protein